MRTLGAKDKVAARNMNREKEYAVDFLTAEGHVNSVSSYGASKKEALVSATQYLSKKGLVPTGKISFTGYYTE